MENKKKKNLLLIMCDQLRADVLGCYGESLVKTPNIDRLAARGTVFENAYSQTPVCVPARYGLISGQNPAKIDMWVNKTNVPVVAHPLAEEIRRQGYYTAAVGKMHFFPPRKHYGFDRMLLAEEIPGHIKDDDYLPFLRQNGFGDVTEPHGMRSEHYYEPQVSPLPLDLHSSAWTAKTAAGEVSDNAARPFFLFTSFIKPHPPFEPCPNYAQLYPPEKTHPPVRCAAELSPYDNDIIVQNGYKVGGADKVDDAALGKIRAAYYGCVSQVDEQIGLLLNSLETAGVLEDTVIVFTADHGEMLGDHYAFGKRVYYEQACRVPLIVAGPGVNSGARQAGLCCLSDVYATLLCAAGAPLPGECDGVDLLPFCKNGKDEIHAQILAGHGQGRARKFMLRFGDYKYLYFENGGREVLFSMAGAREELCDISGENPAAAAKGRSLLIEELKKAGLTQCLENGQLRAFAYEKAAQPGFLNQSPAWPGR